MRRKTVTASSEYGGFYEAQNRQDYDMVDLPPITNQHIESMKIQESRHKSEISPYRSRDTLNVHLPDIRNIDIEMTTNNRGSMHIHQTGKGLSYTTNPPGLNNVTLPDIRDVNIKLTREDGSVITIPAKSRYAL